MFEYSYFGNAFGNYNIILRSFRSCEVSKLLVQIFSRTSLHAEEKLAERVKMYSQWIKGCNTFILMSFASRIQ